MISLEEGKQRRLLASLRLLESDKPGEQQAALEAARRLLPPGVSLADVVQRGVMTVPSSSAPEPVDPSYSAIFRNGGDWMSPWRRKAKKLLQRNAPQFNERETSFLRSMAISRDEPTRKQLAWLDSLAVRGSIGGAL